jgi:hypothetical protein
MTRGSEQKKGNRKKEGGKGRRYARKGEDRNTISTPSLSNGSRRTKIQRQIEKTDSIFPRPLRLPNLPLLLPNLSLLLLPFRPPRQLLRLSPTQLTLLSSLTLTLSVISRALLTLGGLGDPELGLESTLPFGFGELLRFGR